MDVCKRSLAHFQPIIEERGLHVNLQAPEEAEILTPPSHIDILVRNLVENAVKYATARGNIYFSILAGPDAIRLEIVNDSDSPPSWKPEEMFEPFSRPDSSRNAKTGGTGLGLAICKSIADANGWQLGIGSKGRTVDVVLTIPSCMNRT